jgi:hypothetical protein
MPDTFNTRDRTRRTVCAARTKDSVDADLLEFLRS